MKKILIYGKGSYIGEHFREGLDCEGHIVEMIDSYTNKPGDFSVKGYDVVINVVGIAHIKIVADMEPLFYKINTEYAVDLARLCKEHGEILSVYEQYERVRRYQHADIFESPGESEEFLW